MTTPLNSYKFPSTIPARQSKLWGHWNNPEMKDQRDAAREWAKAQGYYERHSGKAP